MDKIKRKPRDKRWAIYKAKPNGKKGIGIGIVMAPTLGEATESARVFFADICQNGVIVEPAPRGFVSGPKIKTED
jgi:hypothetical protein